MGARREWVLGSMPEGRLLEGRVFVSDCLVMGSQILFVCIHNTASGSGQLSSLVE